MDRDDRSCQQCAGASCRSVCNKFADVTVWASEVLPGWSWLAKQLNPSGPQFVGRSSWSSSARWRSSRSASDSSSGSGHLLRLNGLSPPSGLVDHQLPGPAGAKTAAGLRTSAAGREWLREKGHADAAPAARRRPVIADEPAIADVGTAVCIIPTDEPEADGTLAWNETTLAPVTVPGRKRAGISWPMPRSRWRG